MIDLRYSRRDFLSWLSDWDLRAWLRRRTLRPLFKGLTFSLYSSHSLPVSSFEAKNSVSGSIIISSFSMAMLVCVCVFCVWERKRAAWKFLKSLLGSKGLLQVQGRCEVNCAYKAGGWGVVRFVPDLCTSWILKNLGQLLWIRPLTLYGLLIKLIRAYPAICILHPLKLPLNKLISFQN